MTTETRFESRAATAGGLPLEEIQRAWPARSLVPSYEAYRRHQARALLALMPREGLRELYGLARDVRASADAGAKGRVLDPMDALLGFVERFLPLPPFHVWCQDVRTNPGAHLDEPWMADALPAAAAPRTVAVREEHLRGGPWRVELRVHHEREEWRGHLAFTGGAQSRSWRTGDVLREPTAGLLVERFHELGVLTLDAFLRSILP